MPRIYLALAAAGAVYFASLPAARGQTVWSGYDFSFSKADFADISLPENQDRITDNVWIVRKINEGIFNVVDEETYTTDSPADTEWATYINNPTDTIAASNYANLTFEPWIAAYGGQGGMSLPDRLTGGAAVMHLITDDIYLDIHFTDWTAQTGGGFAYDRALPPAGPETTGDYNLNGLVDAADYVLWRKTFGDEVTEGTGADGVADGTIDLADYDFWVERFGEPVPLGSGLSTLGVPEPTGFTMTLLVIMLGMIHRRRIQNNLIV